MKKVLLFLMAFIVFAVCACNGKTSTMTSESEGESVSVSGEELSEFTPERLTVTINQLSQIGGRVMADKTDLEYGESVTITVTLEEGYQIEYFRVNNLDVELDENNQYVVSYAVYNITVSAKFRTIGEDNIIYVSKENAPKIDGEIDAVWKNAPTFYINNIYNHNNSEVFSEEIAYLKALWNEAGMYFLGVVYDSNVLESDRFNIWFSEVYTNQTKEYSANRKDGNYAICINPNAENLLYTSLDISAYWTADSIINNNGYLVEIFVPVLGETPLQENATVGLDVSVDYFSKNGSIDNDRDYYANWYGVSNYWSNVGALKEMKLIKL